jgi:uncharacterized RDD family membrane protein YckC
MNERYTIDTPENIEFSYSIAGIGSRFLGAIVDTVLLLILQAALMVVMLILISQAEALPDSGGGSSVVSVLGAVWALLSFIFFWGYYILFELFWNGQTPGKRLIGLRVVREGGRPITFVGSAIRNLIRVIDFLPGLYGLGVLVMFIDRNARRLGDLAGGTLVVKDRVAISLDSLTPTPNPTPEQVRIQAGVAAAQATGSSPTDSFTPTIPNLHTLTTADYNLIEEFLRRRRELGRDSRASLGTQLAHGISNRLAVSLDAANAETFLEHVAQEYRLMQEAGNRGQA